MRKFLTFAGLLGGMSTGLSGGCGTARSTGPEPTKAPLNARLTSPDTATNDTTNAVANRVTPAAKTTPAPTLEPSGAELVAILTAPKPATPMTIVRIVNAELDATTQVVAPESQVPSFLDAAAIVVRGTRTRIAFDTPDVRLLLWVPNSAVARYIAADLVLQQPHSFGSEPAGYVKLRAGAVVEELSHTDDKIAIRHLGALQVTGTVPRSALTSEVPERRMGPPAGYNTIVTIPGALIRQQPTVTAPVLATVNTGYQLVRLRSVDKTWDEVAFTDFSVDVRGYYAKTMPPGSRQGQGQQRSQLALENTGDTNLAAGTCLYASAGGAITGVVKTDCKATVTASARSGWSNVELATPWGPLTVALRNTAPATGHQFANCTEP